MRAASIKSLMELKDVTEGEASLVREIWKCGGRHALRNLLSGSEFAPKKWDSVYQDYMAGRIEWMAMKRELIRMTLNYFEIEYLGKNRRDDGEIYALNAGDIYVPTVIFKPFELSVECVGDVVARLTPEVEY